MANLLFGADHHYFHTKMVEGFGKNESSEHEGEESKRPWNTVEEHNEALIANHNSVVKPADTFYMLGDCFLNNGDDYTPLRRMNGKIKIIVGNHCTWNRIKNYVKLAEEGVIHSVEGYGTIGKDVILSHIPVHDSQVSYRFKWNIHGHLHNGVVNDPRYFCASMDRINFTPISYEEIKAIMRERGV